MSSTAWAGLLRQMRVWERPIRLGRSKLWMAGIFIISEVYGAAKPISIGAFGFCVFTITALAGCTSTSLYLISSTGFKENSYDFFLTGGRRWNALSSTMRLAPKAHHSYRQPGAAPQESDHS